MGCYIIMSRGSIKEPLGSIPVNQRAWKGHNNKHQWKWVWNTLHTAGLVKYYSVITSIQGCHLWTPQEVEMSHKPQYFIYIHTINLITFSPHHTSVMYHLKAIGSHVPMHRRGNTMSFASVIVSLNIIVTLSGTWGTSNIIGRHH
jgi:hypothetical protein